MMSTRDEAIMATNLALVAWSHAVIQIRHLQGVAPDLIGDQMVAAMDVIDTTLRSVSRTTSPRTPIDVAEMIAESDRAIDEAFAGRG